MDDDDDMELADCLDLLDDFDDDDDDDDNGGYAQQKKTFTQRMKDSNTAVAGGPTRTRLISNATPSIQPPKRSLPSSSASASLGSNSAKASLSQPSSKEYDHVERYSGLRIKSRTASRSELDNHFRRLEFLPISDLKRHVDKSGDIGKDWGTVAVVSSRSDPRAGSSGKAYMILKLTNLARSEVSVFLFGAAYDQWRRESEGTIFGKEQRALEPVCICFSFVFPLNVVQPS